MLRNRAFVKMTKSQQSVGQHQRDLAFIRQRLEQQLRSLHTDRTIPPNKLPLILSDIQSLKSTLSQLKTQATSFDALRQQMLSSIGKICSEYENCMSEMRFRLSLLEDDLADSEKKLRIKEDQNERLEKELGESQRQLQELQVGYGKSRHLEMELEESKNNKAESERQIADLNIRINELLMIVHERNSRVSLLQNQLKSTQLFQQSSCSLLFPDITSKVLTNKNFDSTSKKIENINVLAVKQVTPKTSENREPKGSQSMRQSLNQNMVVGQVVSSKKDIKTINREVMERMQSFISEMTLTHRAKAEGLASYRKKSNGREHKEDNKVNQKWFSVNSKQGQKLELTRQYTSRR